MATAAAGGGGAGGGDGGCAGGESGTAPTAWSLSVCSKGKGKTISILAAGGPSSYAADVSSRQPATKIAVTASIVVDDGSIEQAMASAESETSGGGLALSSSLVTNGANGGPDWLEGFAVDLVTWRSWRTRSARRSLEPPGGSSGKRRSLSDT